MDLAKLNQKLIAAARCHPPSDRVPYAFEKRVMQLLQAQPVMDELALWSRALWRSAAACLAVVFLLGCISFVSYVHNPPAGNDLSQDFENTMLAAVDQETDSLP